MEYRGASLSKNLSEEPWNYYNQARRGAWEEAASLANGGCFSCQWSRGNRAASVATAAGGRRLLQFHIELVH